MKFDFSPVRNWFGYTRREKRASFILLVLILGVVSVRFLVPENKIDIETIPLSFKTDSAVSGPSSSSGKISPRIQKTETRKKKEQIVDINRCDTAELIKLPGIGPVLSVRIIKYRQLLGGFAEKEQLREVYGLPAETYDLIKDRISVDTLVITKINVNTADFKSFDRMPYFERNEITAIIKYRELEGKIRSISELVDNNLISEDKARRLKAYLRFE